MTKGGAAFIGAGVVVYLLGGQTQIGWLYLLDAMIWSLVVLSALLPWWSLRSLRIERQVWLPSPANGRQAQALPIEGGTVEVRLTVTNRGRLARHFIIQSIRAALETSGCSVISAVVGPLRSLEQSLPTSFQGLWVSADHRGSESGGYWLIRNDLPLAWAEVASGETDSEHGTAPRTVPTDVFGSLFDAESGDLPLRELVAYAPSIEANTGSRWKIPNDPKGHDSSTVGDHIRAIRALMLDRWAAWVFRWSVVVGLSAGALGLLGHVSTLTANALRGPSHEETTFWTDRLKTLEHEHERLTSDREERADLVHHFVDAARLWHDVGISLPESVWLRGIRLQSSKGHVTWRLSGLSTAREGPGKLARALNERPGWNTRLVRMVKADATRARAVPMSLKESTYRFELKVSR